MQYLKIGDQKIRTGKWRTNGLNVCAVEEVSFMRDCVVEKLGCKTVTVNSM